LEAFAQFGSDLDKATKAKLDRGVRTVEVLKQDLNKPIKVEKQVMILFALTKGHLDDIPVADIRRFEEEYYVFLDKNHPELLDHIRTTKGLPEDADIVAAINEFKKSFVISE
jgi:F-type H+-transporting ATPase subunit alpha